MTMELSAVVSLDKSGFASGMSALGTLCSNITGSMMTAFGGVTTEIFAMQRAFGPVGAAVSILKSVSTVGMVAQEAMAGLRVETGLSADKLKGLADTAATLSGKMTQSMPEIVTAMKQLHAAGAETAEEIQQALVPALELARLSGLEMSVTTESLVKTLKMFGLGTSDAKQAVDMFTAAVAVEDLARFTEAMMSAGTIAHSLGISMSETAAVLSKFEEAGIEGEAAGKQFAMVLDKLSDAARTMKGAIGEALAGWSPATEGMAGALDRLKAAGVSSQEIFEAFGARTGKAMLALMQEGGPALQALTDKISQGGDAAQLMAEKNATLGAAVMMLKNSIENLLVSAFVPMAEALRNVVQQIQSLVEWFGKLTGAMLGGDWATVKTMLVGVFDSALAAAKSAFDGIREGAGKIAEAFKAIDWGQAFDTLKTTAVNTWAAIISESSSALSKISAYLQNQNWSEVWDAVKQGAATAFNFWYGTAAEVWGKIASYLRGISGAELWEAIRAGAAKVWTEIESIAKAVWPAIQEYGRNAWAAIAEAGRVAWETIKNAISQIDWSGLLSRIGTAIAGAWSMAEKIVYEWIDSAVAAFREADWGAIGAGIMTAIIGVRDFIVDKFHELVSGDTIPNLFSKLGEIIGATLKAALQGIGGAIAALFSDMESGNFKDKFTQLWTDIFVGSMKAVTGLFTGLLEGLFGKHVVDNVVVGAELMMLDIREAIQRKIGSILEAFNELMAGIITKTSAGAARIAEVFGFEGLAEKIQTKAQAFSEAFRAGVNPMITAADKTAEQIAGLEQYLAGLNSPANEAGESVKTLGNETAKATTSFGDLFKSLFNLKPHMEAVTQEVKAGASFWDTYQAKVRESQEAMAGEAIAMHAVAPAATAMASSLVALEGQMGKIADSSKTMSKAMEDIKNIGVAIKIDLPNMTDQIAKIWGNFFDLLQDVASKNLSINISLPEMRNNLVTIWEKFFKILEGASGKAISVKIELPDMSDRLARVWGTFFEKLNGVKSANLSINVVLPQMTDSIANSWAKFFSVFKGGSVSIPDVGTIQTDIASIAGSLKILAGLKGIIWA